MVPLPSRRIPLRLHTRAEFYRLSEHNMEVQEKTFLKNLTAVHSKSTLLCRQASFVLTKQKCYCSQWPFIIAPPGIPIAPH